MHSFKKIITVFKEFSMKRSYLLMSLAVALVGVPLARGQSVWPSTLNATGGSATISGRQFEWSVGEMTLVNTFATSTVVLTQGILQPGISVTEVGHTAYFQQVEVFPNPTDAIVNVRFNSLLQGTLAMRLMDMAGRVVLEQSIDVFQGLNTTQVNMANLAGATYMLQLSLTGAGGSEEMASYKIQKLQ